MVKETEFDPQSYVASPFAAPESLPATAPMVAETPSDAEASPTDDVAVTVAPVDEASADETPVVTAPVFEPVVLEFPSQLVFRAPDPAFVPIRCQSSR
jgi:hypothetical protein